MQGSWVLHHPNFLKPWGTSLCVDMGQGEQEIRDALDFGRCGAGRAVRGKERILEKTGRVKMVGRCSKQEQEGRKEGNQEWKK